jgi:hypothetical protein
MIFVFGSNLAGRHGKGAALEALRHYGAKRGVGFGHEGLSFAIPTKDEKLKRLPLPKINGYAQLFLECRGSSRRQPTAGCDWRAWRRRGPRSAGHGDRDHPLESDTLLSESAWQ